MNIELQYKIRNNSNDLRYLREKSYWYKYLNRNKNYIQKFEEEMKENYKIRTEDRMEKLANSLDMMSKLINILQ